MDGRIDSFELVHSRGATRHLYGEGAVAAGAERLADRLAGRTVVVVSARPILDLHASALEPLLAPAGRAVTLEVPDGEAAKSVEEATRLWREMLVAGARRDSLIVAFGGGTVSDLAGFVAAGFMRGVDWIAVPTTLLAQVDAAVGGKTGVDLPAAKNAVGAFHHALAVLAEPGLLSTLKEEHRRAGLVEAVKTGAVLDAALFERIERSLDGLLAGDPERMAAIAAAAARAKARLVASDLEESGLRQLLNFGHTLGHALEAEIGFGRIAHGDAVAHGMRFALALSRREGTDAAFADRLESLLARLDVPALPQLSAAPLLDRLAGDKKQRAGGLGWVLLSGAGAARFGVGLPREGVAAALEEFLCRPGSRSL